MAVDRLTTAAILGLAAGATTGAGAVYAVMRKRLLEPTEEQVARLTSELEAARTRIAELSREVAALARERDQALAQAAALARERDEAIAKLRDRSQLVQEDAWAPPGTLLARIEVAFGESRSVTFQASRPARRIRVVWRLAHMRRFPVSTGWYRVFFRNPALPTPVVWEGGVEPELRGTPQGANRVYFEEGQSLIDQVLFAGSVYTLELRWMGPKQTPSVARQFEPSWAEVYAA